MSAAVPREFAAVLLTIRLDQTFMMEFPELASRSLQFAEMLDAESCVVCHELSQVCQSLNNTCQFLTAFQQLVMCAVTAHVFLSRRHRCYCSCFYHSLVL